MYYNTLDEKKLFNSDILESDLPASIQYIIHRDEERTRYPIEVEQQ